MTHMKGYDSKKLQQKRNTGWRKLKKNVKNLHGISEKNLQYEKICDIIYSRFLCVPISEK